MARSSTMRDAKSKAFERDMGFHDRIRAAHETGQIHIYTNFPHLNRGGSPVFSAGDNVAPLLFLILSSVVLLFVHVILGLVGLVVSVIIYLMVIRPWIANRLRDRTVRKMMANLYNWRQLWAFGGIVITLADNPRVGCTAPDSDWRAMARKFTVDRDPNEQAAHAAFKGEMGSEPPNSSIYD
ncbi:MAG: hypothetical protein K9H25_21360 [Rhodospirillum sp.]|nr:hypothetical protein [Rhodospirillum sp.]MCF8491650.1 hypothetical protein [Rhodospirillum sp.]MCF8501356.1 hypothetical protein [Rhodospirillum sp.]